MPLADWLNELPFSVVDTTVRSENPSEIELEVVALFEQLRDPILRYARSLGIPLHDAEEVTQDTFLALFQHLQLGRSRSNLRSWLFRVTHNLALKRREAIHQSASRTQDFEAIEQQPIDPSPSPEDNVTAAERQARLMAIFDALPATDQSCLRLRAEGLRYREIATVLGVSLGTVSLLLTRSLARLLHADRRGR